MCGGGGGGGVCGGGGGGGVCGGGGSSVFDQRRERGLGGGALGDTVFVGGWRNKGVVCGSGWVGRSVLCRGGVSVGWLAGRGFDERVSSDRSAIRVCRECPTALFDSVITWPGVGVFCVAAGVVF